MSKDLWALPSLLRFSSCLVLTALLLPAAASAKAPPILGEWEMVAGEQRGKRMALPPQMKIRWTFRKGGRLIQSHAVKGQIEPRTVKGRWKLDGKSIEITLKGRKEVMLVFVKGKALTLGKPDKEMKILFQRPGSSAVKISTADLKRTKEEMELYLRKTRATEGREGLDRLKAGAKAYYSSDRFDQKGNLKPHRFAPGRASWTPKTSCCKQPGKRCKPDPRAWSVKPWTSLYFQVTDPHYFQFRYRSTGTGKRSTVLLEARADLNCDGKYSRYKLSGKIGPDMSVLFGKVIEKDSLE